MDFTALEKIVAKRKLPPPPSSDVASKKRRRRIIPTAVASTSQPPTTTTTLATYYSNALTDETAVSVTALQPAYNTTLAHFESSLIVKQRYQLSDTVYILIGTDVELQFAPRMYIIDKKWWMQFTLDPECIRTMMYFRKKIDDYFSVDEVKDFTTLYTNHVKVKPSSCKTETLISLTREHSLREELSLDNSLFPGYAYIEEAENPVPTITLTHDEWKKLCLYGECITEYYYLCSRCQGPANKLIERYIKLFKDQFRSVAAAAAATRSQQEMERARDEVKQKLPTEFAAFHWRRLPTQVEDYDGESCGIVSVFETWLDAELRTHCRERVTKEVMDELAWEFSWLKIE